MASALKTWEFENTVELVDQSRDALYTYDHDAHKTFTDSKPWKQNPHFFTSCRISAVALLKMVMHARSGGPLEIMGLMQGYTTPAGEIIVTDAFRLPVEGTETRVNAQAEADAYMVEFLRRAREAGQLENAVGWYHSHPGYGCWLSGIDVATQSTHQSFNDPFVAVVIDPDRTISAGKVEIGAFRTFPEGYNKADAGDAAASVGGEAVDADGFQTIPVGKIEDFGAHSARYYSLDVSHFKSSLDTRLLEALWNKYWVGTLASSPLITNRDYGTKQMADLALKIRMADKAAGGGSGNRRGVNGSGGQTQVWERATGKAREQQLDKIVKAGNKIAAEEQSGLMATEIKEKLFSGVGVHDGPA